MIYVPRDSVSMLVAQHENNDLTNPTICVKMDYNGFEISIACDSSHGSGDLARTDIRIYRDNEDISAQVWHSADTIVGTSYNLKQVFDCIDQFQGGGRPFPRFF